MESDYPGGPVSLKGFCTHLRRVESLPADSAERSIQADVVFDQHLNLHTDRNVRRVSFAQLSIRPLNDPRKLSDLGLPNEEQHQIYSGDREGALIAVDGSSYSFLVATIHVTMPVEAFHALWKSTPATGLASLKIQLPQSMEFRAPHPEDDFGEVDHIQIVSSFEFSAVSDATAALPRIREVQAKAFCDALSAVGHLKISHGDYPYNNQMYRVVSELANSAIERQPSIAELTQGFETVTEILSEIREAFRKPREFKNSIVDLDAAEVKSLESRSDSIWQHFNIGDILKRGEAVTGPSKHGFEPQVDELNHFAQRILALKGMHSSFLEWALVNALIYAECIKFARCVQSTETFLGFNMSSKPWSEPWAKASPKKLWKFAIIRLGSLVLEAIMIGLTFVVANYLTQENVLATWTITTGVTMARWICAAIFRSANPLFNSEEKKLLRRMTSVHSLIEDGDFNARLLRDQLYRITDEGARFSDWVFHILDARIQRVGKG